MSQYIHEIVLQEFIIENLKRLNIFVNSQNTLVELVDIGLNKRGPFWDLEGKTENGDLVPVKVEWISSNFLNHRNDKSKDFPRFLKENGVLLVLRKNREIPNVKQISIDTMRLFSIPSVSGLNVNSSEPEPA